MIKTTFDLQGLKIQELNRMLKHIKLGKEHLNKHLSKNDFLELLKLAHLPAEQKDHLAANKREKTGNASVVLNTIITSIFGGWLGMTGFGLFKFNPYFTIFIILAALLIGGLVGYLGYQLSHKQAQEAIIEQKLYQIQLMIIDMILTKRSTAITAIENNISHMINKILDEKMVGRPSTTILQYFLPNEKKHCLLRRKLHEAIKHIANKPLRQHYRNIMNDIFRTLQKISLKLQNTLSPEDASAHSKENPLLKLDANRISSLRSLMLSAFPVKKITPNIATWLRKNFLAICVGLMPTMLGTFASMFVFLNGIPALIQAFDIHLYAPEKIADIRYGSLIIAIFIPVYFGYSYLYSQYKSYLRVKQFEAIENKIIEKTTLMLHQETHLHNLIKINYNLRQLITIRDTISLLAHEKAELVNT